MVPRRQGVSLRQIEVFARVYEARSLAAGARSLGLAQPTATSHLRLLEQELGIPLFARNGRRVEPTGAGDRLYAHAHRLLGLKDEAVAAIARLGPGLRGDLVLGASSTPGTFLLPPLVAPFLEAHPNVRVALQIAPADEVLSRLRQGAVSIGFVGAEPDLRTFAARPFGIDRIVLVAPPLHPQAGKIVAVRALADERHVVRPRGSGTRCAVEHALADHQLAFGESLNVALEAGSNEAAREAVRAGAGVAFLSQLAVRQELESGTLAQIRVRGLSIERRFYSVTAKGRPVPPEAQALLTLLDPRTSGSAGSLPA